MKYEEAFDAWCVVVFGALLTAFFCLILVALHPIGYFLVGAFAILWLPPWLYVKFRALMEAREK